MPQDLLLPLGELAGDALLLAAQRAGLREAVELRHHMRGHGRVQVGLASGHGADGLHQLVCGGVFQQIAAGARTQRLKHILLLVKDGQHQHPHVRVLGTDAPRGLHSVHHRHPQVHQHHMRLVFRGQPQRLLPVCRLRHHLHPAVQAKQLEHGLTKGGLVVHEKNFDACGHRFMRI